MEKYLITLQVLLEVDSDDGGTFDAAEEEIKSALLNLLDFEGDTVSVFVENPEWNEMAMTEEPSEEEAADGYFQGEDSETDEEIEAGVSWHVRDVEVVHATELPYVGQELVRTVDGAVKLIEKDKK